MVYMQQVGEGSYLVELFVVYDVQIVDIVFYLVQLGGEGIDFIVVMECDYLVLQGIFQYNVYLIGEYG